MELRLKKARTNVSELLHDAFLAKAARSKEKQWHGLNGREKLLFLEPCQTMECMAGKRSSDGKTSSGSQSHLAHAEHRRTAPLF